ncbi:MAG: hypothetical protein ACT4N3_10290 [Sphingosinicella sp.]
MTVECMCDSCREAGAILESLPAAAPVLDGKGATLSAMYRKDRVECSRGAEHMREFRLNPESKTRRVVATCCNSAMFLEFTKGHWLDIYGKRWPPLAMPRPEMRTMVGDLPAGPAVPDDIPNSKTHSLTFFVRLLGAWAAMRFRSPAINFVHGAIDAR